jgi:hypothetical protein
MAVFFTEGWDENSVDPVSGIPIGWDVVAGNGINAINATAARNGANGLQLGASSQGRALSKNITSVSTIIVGWAMNIQSGVATQVLSLNDSGGTQVSLNFDATGGITFYRGNPFTNQLASPSTITVGSGVWHYYEAKIFISATVGTVELHVDGVQTISGNNLNTKGSSTAGISQVEFFAPGGTAWFFDDIIFNDTTGLVNPSFLGDVKVLGEVPSGNGTQNNFAASGQNWVGGVVQAVGDQLIDSNGNLQQVISVSSDAKTGGSPPVWQTTVGLTVVDNHVTWRCVAVAPLLNYEFVNEPVQDGDDSFLFDTTVSDQDRYVFAAVSAASVFAVAAKAVMKKDDVGTRTARLVALSNGTLADNGTDLPLSTTYSQLVGVFEADPHTGGVWTQNNANNAEFGVKITA